MRPNLNRGRGGNLLKSGGWMNKAIGLITDNRRESFSSVQNVLCLFRFRLSISFRCRTTIKLVLLYSPLQSVVLDLLWASLPSPHSRRERGVLPRHGTDFPTRWRSLGDGAGGRGALEERCR